MDDKSRIPFPSEEEMTASVAAIVEAGVQQPPRWRDLLRAIPPAVLFFGVGDVLFLALLLTAAIYALAASAAGQVLDAAPLVFLLSPFLYASMHLLTDWKERTDGLAEWKQTCRVPPGALTALRMLVFGGVSAVLAAPLNAVLWALNGRVMPLAWMLGLSFSSLFLFAAASLLCMKRRALAALPPVLWLALSFAARWLPWAGKLLLSLPAWVFFLLAAVGLAVYLRGLTRVMTRSMKGEAAYAVD